MTDRNEMNENNELNDQELEQTAGGIIFDKNCDNITANYSCPNCGSKIQSDGLESMVMCEGAGARRRGRGPVVS